MEQKSFNWGTLILGIVIGAVVVGIIWAATKPATTAGVGVGGFTPAVLKDCMPGINSCREAMECLNDAGFAITVDCVDPLN